jgi:hypothetical protein
MGTIEHSYHDLAFSEPCRSSFVQGLISRGLTNGDPEFPVRIGGEKQEVRVPCFSRTGYGSLKVGQKNAAGFGVTRKSTEDSCIC